MIFGVLVDAVGIARDAEELFLADFSRSRYADLIEFAFATHRFGAKIYRTLCLVFNGVQTMTNRPSSNASSTIAYSAERN